jgi:4-amino-4-deoxychorismate lyase
MRRNVDGSVERLEGHLDRLANSADALEIRCDIDAIRSTIMAVPSTSTDLRLRLELKADGQWEITSHAFAKDPPGRIWQLKIARTRLRSSDPYLCHKTTLRHHYEKARLEHTTEAADEILLLNERDEVCEGTITSVFVRPANQQLLLTPALSCGLLKGVLRQQLIDGGRACEAILTPHDLESADMLFVGNSLRGLIKAEMTTEVEAKANNK